MAVSVNNTHLLATLRIPPPTIFGNSLGQRHIKANAYTTLVRPQLEYAASIWDPYTAVNQNKLEMIQRLAARFCCNNYARKASVTLMLEELGWRSLLQRRANLRLILFFKCLHGLVAVDIGRDLTPQRRDSRHAQPMSFNIPSETTQYLQKRFLSRTIAQWNALPPSIALSPSLDAFREGVSGITH